MPENKNYNPIVISQESKLSIWGVVTSVIKKYNTNSGVIFNFSINRKIVKS
jgi:hypothetical protein